MAKKSFSVVLKQLSGIGIGAAALLYGCGYLVHTVYYRLLGIQAGAQPLTYLTFSGDYLVSILFSAPQLGSIWLYWPKLVERAIWPSIGLCVLSLLASVLLARRSGSRKLSQLSCMVLALICVFVISSELHVLRTQNVLQPFSPNDLQGGSEVIGQESLKSVGQRARIIKETYEEYQQLAANNQGFDQWNRWFNPLNPSNEKERTAEYLAFLLLNILFLSVIVVALRFRQASLYRKWLIVDATAGLLSIILLFPCIYATLGRVYLFPVVTLRLKTVAQGSSAAIRNSPESSSNGSATPKTDVSASKELITHPVFLVFEDATQIVVYDRLNLFQLKIIPRDRVLGVTQIYTSSPFVDCSLKGGFSPCEAKWLPESTYVVDY